MSEEHSTAGIKQEIKFLIFDVSRSYDERAARFADYEHRNTIIYYVSRMYNFALDTN